MTLCTIRKPHLPGTELGVNESARDSARAIDGMFQGIFARVGEQKEINELARYSPVPVLKALLALASHPEPCQTTHPPQTCSAFRPSPHRSATRRQAAPQFTPSHHCLLIGDSTNVLHDMLVAYPHLGHKMCVASPPHPAYQCPEAV